MSALFKEIVPGILLLESPFGAIWSGIILIRGEQNILIDSGANAGVVEDCLIPALRSEGLEAGEISWLLSTHSHGDHIGGHYRMRELSGAKIAAFRGSVEKLRDPLKYSRLIRARYPEFSPPPPPVLRGVEPDMLIDDGELFAGRLRLVHAPGHDDDCVCWFDEVTRTLITGDSLQANGAKGQGIAFYQYLPAYRDTLRRLSEIHADNLTASHCYLPCGATALGRRAVEKYISTCRDIVDYYDRFISQKLIDGERDLVSITHRLIEESGGRIPEYLFLALYTVGEHIKAHR